MIPCKHSEEMLTESDAGRVKEMPPVFLIRKRHILYKLAVSGAVSPESARTLDDAGVLNPNAFIFFTDMLARKGFICRTADGRYYLPEKK